MTPDEFRNFLETHTPRIGSWIDDSTWLECDCGYDESESTIGWYDHLEAALDREIDLAAERAAAAVRGG